MATKKLATKAAGPATRGLQIVARREVFYRCGRAFSATPTTIALSELTEDEVERLKAEPQLVVVEVDMPAEPAEATET